MVYAVVAADFTHACRKDTVVSVGQLRRIALDGVSSHVVDNSLDEIARLIFEYGQQQINEAESHSSRPQHSRHTSVQDQNRPCDRSSAGLRWGRHVQGHIQARVEQNP